MNNNIKYSIKYAEQEINRIIPIGYTDNVQKSLLSLLKVINELNNEITELRGELKNYSQKSP